MSDKRKILVQLDTDPHPSVFDRVVAIDAGADELFSYGGVTPQQVAGLVHGAIFTRKPSDLKRTAVFVGGSDVAAGEALVAAALKAMIPDFGLRVSVLLDPQRLAHTTAAAAVRVAARHLELSGARALVLGGTGPVGQRVGLLLRCRGRTSGWPHGNNRGRRPLCEAIVARVPGAKLEPVAVAQEQDLHAVAGDRTLIVAAGAAGAVLLPKSARPACKELKDRPSTLNAVPAAGRRGRRGGRPGEGARRRDRLRGDRRRRNQDETAPGRGGEGSSRGTTR